MNSQHDVFADMIRMISAASLAKLWGYSGPTDAFRVFCTKLSITHIPGAPVGSTHALCAVVWMRHRVSPHRVHRAGRG